MMLFPFVEHLLPLKPNYLYFLSLSGSVGGASGKESTCQCRRHKKWRFDPWVGKILWSRKWQPTPVFLPGKFHGQRRILVGHSPQSHKKLDTTERVHVCVRAHTHTHTHSLSCVSQLGCQLLVCLIFLHTLHCPYLATQVFVQLI